MSQFYYLKTNIIQYVIISILKKDVVQYTSNFEFMIKIFFLLENTLLMLELFFI